jgi:hypothetical protein
VDEAEFGFGEDEALVIEQEHLADATLEPTALDVSDQAYLELAGHRVDTASVDRRCATVLLDHFAVDLCDQLREALDDLEVAHSPAKFDDGVYSLGRSHLVEQPTLV